MDWMQFSIFIFTFFGGLFWVRSDTNAQILAYRQETAAQLQAIQSEMKDFHGRLCAIEERNRK